MKYSKPIVVVAALLLSATLPLDAARNDDRQCRKTKEKIRAVQSRMRSGYTRAQGEKLEAELRKLRAKRKKVCR